MKAPMPAVAEPRADEGGQVEDAHAPAARRGVKKRSLARSIPRSGSMNSGPTS